MLLRSDHSEEQSLFLRMGEWQFVRTHLLPLLRDSPCLEDGIGYLAVRVLVRLTLPPAAIFEHRSTRIAHLQQYKQWMLDAQSTTFVTLMFLLSQALPFVAEKTNPQQKLLELGLTLIRNILAIPDPVGAVTDWDQKLQDRCIEALDEGLVLGEQHAQTKHTQPTCHTHSQQNASCTIHACYAWI